MSLKLLDIVLDSSAALFEESFVTSMHNVRPFSPLVNEGKVFTAEKPKFECTRNPHVFRAVFNPLRVIARNVF